MTPMSPVVHQSASPIPLYGVEVSERKVEADWIPRKIKHLVKILNSKLRCVVISHWYLMVTFFTYGTF
jgi:hypothetical protein